MNSNWKGSLTRIVRESVACPFCKSQRGEFCTTPKGNISPMHKTRVALYKQSNTFLGF